MILQFGGAVQHALVGEHPVLGLLGIGAVLAHRAVALRPAVVDEGDVRAGAPGLHQLLDAADVRVELVVIDIGRFAVAPAVEAHHAAYIAGPSPVAIAVVGGPDVPDDPLEAGGILNVGLLQHPLEGIAVQVAVAAGLGGQHLVLELRSAGHVAVVVDLVAGGEVVGDVLVDVGIGP